MTLSYMEFECRICKHIFTQTSRTRKLEFCEPCKKIRKSQQSKINSERIMKERKQEAKSILHGASNFSQYSFCKDCKRPILDQSRSKKKARCEFCSINHVVKIKQLSAERIARENREKKKLATNTNDDLINT